MSLALLIFSKTLTLDCPIDVNLWLEKQMINQCQSTKLVYGINWYWSNINEQLTSGKSCLSIAFDWQNKRIMYLMGGIDRYIDDASVDISVDTWLSIGCYSVEYWSIYQSTIDRCIDWYSYRSIFLVVQRYFTNTSPILQWCFTDTLPSPSMLVDIGQYIGWYMGRHSTCR